MSDRRIIKKEALAGGIIVGIGGAVAGGCVGFGVCGPIGAVGGVVVGGVVIGLSTYKVIDHWKTIWPYIKCPFIAFINLFGCEINNDDNPYPKMWETIKGGTKETCHYIGEKTKGTCHNIRDKWYEAFPPAIRTKMEKIIELNSKIPELSNRNDLSGISTTFLEIYKLCTEICDKYKIDRVKITPPDKEDEIDYFWSALLTEKIIFIYLSKNRQYLGREFLERQSGIKSDVITDASAPINGVNEKTIEEKRFDISEKINKNEDKIKRNREGIDKNEKKLQEKREEMTKNEEKKLKCDKKIKSLEEKIRNLNEKKDKYLKKRTKLDDTRKELCEYDSNLYTKFLEKMNIAITDIIRPVLDKTGDSGVKYDVYEFLSGSILSYIHNATIDITVEGITIREGSRVVPLHYDM